MPDGSLPFPKTGWLVRRMVVGERLVIARPDRAPVTLTLLAPRRSFEGMGLISDEGVQVFIPLRRVIEPVPGVLISPRRNVSMALHSEDISWTRFMAPEPAPPSEPIPF